MSKILKNLALINIVLISVGIGEAVLLISGISIDEMSELSWPWYISRAMGLLSFILMALIMIAGLTMTTDTVEKSRISKYITRGDTYNFHRTISIALILTLSIHIFALLFDKFLNPSILELLIPFTIKSYTNYVALGIFAFYIFLVVTIVSVYVKIFSKKIWRVFHYATFFVFLLSSIHALLIGTDTKIFMIRFSILVLILLVIILAIIRIINFVRNGKRL